MISSTHLVRLLREANLQSYVVVETPAASIRLEQIVQSGLLSCSFSAVDLSNSGIHGIFEAPDANANGHLPPAGVQDFTLPATFTVEQAINEFCQMPQQILLIGAFTIIKSLELALDALGIAGRFDGMPISVRWDDGDFALPWPKEVTSSRRIHEISQRTGSVIYVRQRLPLYVEYLDKLITGEKVTTVRFRPGAIEVPASISIPVHRTYDFGRGDRSNPTVLVSVSGISYIRYGELDEADATRDGFADLRAMRAALAKIYQGIADDAWLTVYQISPLADGGLKHE